MRKGLTGSNVAVNPVRITDLVLRDAHQSLLATRMRTEDMLPIAAKMNRAGYWSVEMWGGATFDSMMRFLNEDPWERVRALKTTMPDTRLQMLLRGQNAVDIATTPTTWCASSCAWLPRWHRRFRVFDALNDPATWRRPSPLSKAVSGWRHDQLHKPRSQRQSFLSTRRLAELGAQSFCIKDMAGLLDPQDAYELVSALKAAHPDILVHMHCHYTSGMASMAYLKAVEAGADILDCAISSMSMGTSHPPTESMAGALAGTDRATGMDIGVLEEISEYFREVRKKYRTYESAFTAVDPAVLLWQIPGGMISNLSSQLKDQDALDRMEEVLAEVPRVRQELGYPPLVTPTSQIVGTQATLNVLMGRYQMVTKETKAYVQGYYGRPPGAVDPEVQKLIIGDEEPITSRPADVLEPELPKRRAELEELGIEFTDEDLVSYALFPQVALEFFARRDRAERPRDELAALVAAVAALLGVDREVVCVPASVEVGVIAGGNGGGSEGPAKTEGSIELSAAAWPPTGSAWAAAGRAELVGARAAAWRY
jgi:pyruvate/oxaloacetate carboxyltransferase